MIRRSLVFGLSLAAAGFAGPAAAQNDKPILIGVNTAIQLQVGRDAVNAVKMAITRSSRRAASTAASSR